MTATLWATCKEPNSLSEGEIQRRFALTSRVMVQEVRVQVVEKLVKNVLRALLNVLVRAS